MERTLSRRDFLVGAAAAGAALGIAGCTPQGGDVVAKTEDVKAPDTGGEAEGGKGGRGVRAARAAQRPIPRPSAG
ncbi:MAG: twin-arginine translocation signal domain-containing protein [Enterorhabdus sp.]|nr:twin-arginine translocation signal domain-containing protein [Enterorhabdus sp.]